MPVTKKNQGRTRTENYQEVLMTSQNGKAKVSTLSQPIKEQHHNYITNKLSKQALPTPNTKLVGNNDEVNKYRKLVDIFRFNGGRDEVETYLIYWGVSSILQEFLLASAEYDAQRSGGAS